jgi:DNA repair protein RadA/Sms
MGFCPQCRAPGELQAAAGTAASAATVTPIAGVGTDRALRRPVGIDEFDQVLGGGLVAGAAVLVGGEPGVGKSTLLLQVAAGVARAGGSALVATAEESVEQVAMRARRLGVTDPSIFVVASGRVHEIEQAVLDIRPDVVVVDSIQTVVTDEADGMAGGVGQVRASGARLVALAKSQRVPVLLVGHVTKDGSLAGPKVLEHMVDVVLYLEGDSDRGVRVLRGLKNRFGAVHQVGLFEMQDGGMIELADPSAWLVGSRSRNATGTVLLPTLEGRRPLLVEVQALVAKAAGPQPRRSVNGIDPSRVHQILAVLQRHAGMGFADQDVYVSVVGGMRIREPAADLAVALALASSRLGRPLGDVAAWGEVGLTGEVRSVAQADRRRSEATRLGVPSTIAAGEGRLRHIAEVLAHAGLAP